MEILVVELFRRGRGDATEGDKRNQHKRIAAEVDRWRNVWSDPEINLNLCGRATDADDSMLRAGMGKGVFQQNRPKADLTPERAHRLLRASVALRLDKGRQLCAFVSDENGNQFGPLGVTRVGGHSMYRAQRFKERLTDIEYLHRSIVEL